MTGPRSTSSGSGPRVLHNARLVGGNGTLTDVAVRDGVIHAITPARALRSADAGTHDLDGRWLLPGLWDRHVHFDQWAITRDRLDLSGAASAAQAAASVHQALSVGAHGTDAFVGVGFRDALWGDRPDAALLDEQTGNRPVVLISGDLHAVWLNRVALRRYGYPDHPTGLLREQDAFAVQLAVADLAPDRVDELATAATSAAAARGVVGIVDFEQPDAAPVWQRRIAAGNRSLRVVCSVWPQRLDDALDRRARGGDPVDGTDGLATVGPLKVITDGSLNTRTAYCFDPYPEANGAASHGLLTVAADELVELLGRARDGGLGAAVHAIGDHANALALDAFEQVRFGADRYRTIEHVQLIERSDVNRMARLGLTASVQPQHAVDDRDVADRYWSGRTGRAFAYRTLLDAGVTLTLGSDAPVSPLDPWVALAAAVARTRSGRAPWHPEQRISVAEALAASVAGPVEVGAAADLVVVDRDPLTASVEQLRAMPVAATMCRGDWTYGPLP